MRAQLLQLERISRLPNVTIQVLAFSGLYPIGPGGFALLEFAPVHGVKPTDVVYMEHLTGNSFVEEETEAYEYRLAFERLTGRSTRRRCVSEAHPKGRARRLDLTCVQRRV